MMATLAGFICALILAVLVLVWITYCMFFREKHKSEIHQFDIIDISRKNKIPIELEPEDKKKKSVGLAAGIFILPSARRHRRHKEEVSTMYEKRPDYPESPTPAQLSGTQDLVNMFNDSTQESGVTYEKSYSYEKSYTLEIESSSQYQNNDLESSSQYQSDV